MPVCVCCDVLCCAVPWDAQGVVDLFFNPLVNIHLFGRKPEGAYARPFGGAPGGAPGGQPQGMPDLSALLNPGGAKRPAVSQSSSAKE